MLRVRFHVRSLRSMWELRSLFRVIGLLHIIGLCSRTCVTCSSALCSTLVCAVFRLVELLGPPTASLAYQARVYCGCKPGPTRVLPMPRQYGIGRRAPALRTLATSYDFKETWFIDVLYKAAELKRFRSHPTLTVHTVFTTLGGWEVFQSCVQSCS